MLKVSCLIAAYNEAERIGGVLSVVQNHPALLEVIVVDDGSRDNTSAVVRQYANVKLLVQDPNAGKSKAVVRGALEAQGDIILMLDADLQYLTQEHISKLLEPIQNGSADVSISVRENSLRIYKAIGLDFCSGERAFPRRLITDHVDEIRHLTGFGIESFLNRLIIRARMRIAIIPLKGLVNTMKMQKIGFIRGLIAETKMVGQVLRVISPVEVVRQNYWMLKLARMGTSASSKAAVERSHE